MVKRIVDEGHSLGNHTWSHNPEIYNDPNVFLEEVKKVYNFQKEITGKEPRKLFRFPFGSDKANKECIEILENEGFNYIDWNVYLQDGSRNPSSEKAFKLAIDGIHNCLDSPVILTHMERPEKTGPVQALEPIIQQLLEEGYSFLSLNEKDQLIQLK